MPENSLIKQYRNTFEGGLDTDTVNAYLKSNTYKDAQNVSLVTNGQFFSLTNIQGTYNVGPLPGTDGSCNIIGVFRTRFNSSIGTNGVLIFGYDTYNFKIWGAVQATGDPTDITYYEMYEEPLDGMQLQQLSTFDILIDAIGFSETGFDSVYFTDNFHEPRKIRCLIPGTYTPNFLKATEIGLLQRKAVGQITGLPASGGTLLTGTYQVAYQLYNPEINKFTRFSLLSNPIHIYTSDTIRKAGIGLPSSSKITNTIIATADEVANYTHFRIALVKNIYAEGTEAQTLNTVGITKNELISSYTTATTSDFTTITYDIKSDAQYESTTIDEIVTDLLAIDHVKTLTIKRNRLLLGNITTKTLEYDNGDPLISSGSILKAVDPDTTNKDTFTNSIMSSTKVGYFRDEVYRFAISYFDKFGNFSSPKTLDLSTIVNNTITVPIKDMKFPKRYGFNGVGYNILNSNDQCVSLGLNLVGIINHPSWAVGFVILRAKRKKRIQFQTPIIPVAHIYLSGAVGAFPNNAYERTGGKSYPNAVPPGPLITGIPYNMYHGAFADTTDKPYTTDVSNLLQGETRTLSFRTTIGSHIILYPDSSVYSKSPYIFQGNEAFETIDAILSRSYNTVFSDNVNNLGASSTTSCSTSFFAAIGYKQYYSCTYYGSSTPRATAFNLTNAKFVENLSSGTSINGFSILDPSKFTISGIGNTGYPFTNQRCVVSEITDNPTLLDSPFSSLLFYYSSTLYNNSVYATHDANKNITQNYFTFNNSIGGGLGASYSNVIEIGNITIPQNDNRYGDVDDFNEYIFTGTQVNFTLAEQADIQNNISVPKTVDVWGGDCFVSYHTFKISDTVCDIQNPIKTELAPTANQTYQSVAIDWDRSWNGSPTTPATVHYPVFFKNASQYVTLALESEFIGSVRDIDTCDVVTTQNNVPIWGASQPYKSRAPMGYNYNINLKKQNDQKIFIPLDPTIPSQTEFKARVYYSDQKIYNSLINGFDVIRVGNYYDYEEKYGRLVKLAQAGDNLYGIQDKAIFYIPLNERVLEMTDASQLAVRTGDFLGLQLYLSTTKGCQAIQSITEQGKYVYGVDQLNKQVFKISGQELSFISDKGMISKWQQNLSPYIPEFYLRSFYDFLKDEYWVWSLSGDFCQIWNEDYGIWTTNLEFFGGGFNPPGEFHVGPYGLCSGIYSDGEVLLISSGSGPFAAPTTGIMYRGAYSNLFDVYVTPLITFVVNPEVEFAKTFDNLLINSTDRLSSLDMIIVRESVAGNQTMTTVDLTNASGLEPYFRGGEGGYMLKALRDDSTGARMRGLYSNITFKWPTQFKDSNLDSAAIQVGLISAITNARLSAKIF